jgi:phage tail sheath protein FI
MEFTPGVLNREFDLSAYVAAGGSLVIGSVGTAHKGPVNIPTLLSSTSEFIETFGTPTTQAGLLAQIYLAKKGRMYFNRVVDTSAAKSTATALVSAVGIFTGAAKTFGTYGDAYKFKVAASSSGNINEINLEEYLSGELVNRFTDLSSFVELAAVESTILDYAQVGAVAWPADWSLAYAEYTLGGGDSGLSAVDMSPYYRGSVAVNPGTPATGLRVFDDYKKYKCRVITCPGMYHPDVVADGLLLAARRKQTMFFPDAPDNLTADEADAWSLGTYGGGPTVALNTNRGGFFYAWGLFADPYSKSDVYVAPSTVAVAVLANAWEVGNPYMDPAGYLRGNAEALKGLRFSPSDDEVAKTYSRPGHNVNWFVDYPGEGIYLWTQKTLQRASTALDRLNTRITLDIAQETLSARGRRFVHEPNEQPTWDRIAAEAKEVLSEIKAGKGIKDFKVQCDDKINTAAVVARSETRCTISILPMTSIEWLTFDWVLVSQSATL